ncbi:MAG: ribosomal protein L7/L12 [Woeseiaceae bacterium]|nr:ribosomal protein L7/L12 [Woeseiaceae bacterium]
MKSNTDQHLSESVRQSVRAGRKIEAIKLLREEHGLGLKEAKQIIDREVAVYRRANPDAPMAQKTSSLPLIVAVVIVGAALYWYFAN